MQLNRLLLRKPVHDQEFVEGITQRLHFGGKVHKALFVHLQSCIAKLGIDQQPLEGGLPENGGVKVKLKSVRTFRQRPSRSRIEDLPSKCRSKTADSIYPNINIGNTRFDTKRFQRLNQGDIRATITYQLYRHSAHTETAPMFSAQPCRELLTHLFAFASHLSPDLSASILRIQDPTFWQRNDAQGVLHASFPVAVLQCPRTASSGRRLIVVSLGVSYGFLLSDWVSSRFIQPH